MLLGPSESNLLFILNQKYWMIATPFLITALAMLSRGGSRPFHTRPYYNIALLTIINLTSNMLIAESLMFVDTSYWLETIRAYTASFL